MMLALPPSQQLPSTFVQARVGVRLSSHTAQNNSPFPRESSEGNSNVQNRERIAGDFRAKNARNIPAFEITQGDWLRLSAKAFRDHAGDRPGAAKALAAEIECSDKTTRSWLAGETAPSGILDLRAMNRIPAYAALKRKLAAQEAALDPRVQATIQELHRMSLDLAGGSG